MRSTAGDISARINVGLVGGGRGGAALLDLLLSWTGAQVLIVIDPRPDAPAIATARAHGIPTAAHHLAVFDTPVTFVLEVTGRPAVLEALLRAKPAGVEVISAGSLHLFWRLLEDRRAAQERQFKARELQAVGELASRIVRSGASVGKALVGLCRVVESQRPDMVCSVLLVDADGARLRHAAAPNLPDAYVRAVDGLAIGPRAGSCGTAAYRGAPVFVADIATDTLWDDYRAFALPHGLRACWSVPILATTGSVLGTLAMYHRTPGAPGPEDREFIDMAARLAALVIERAQAENALRTSEERYRLLFARNPHPMWVYDPETLRFLDVNDAAVQQYGYPREEFLALTIKDIRPPEDVPAVLAAVASAGATGRYRGGTWRHRKKDGAPLDVEIVSGGITFAGRPARLVLAHDITERRRAEQAAGALARVGRELAGTLDLAEAMHRIVSTLVTFFGVRSAALYRLNETGDTLVCLAGAGGERGAPWIGRTVSLEAGVVGPATAKGRIVQSPDLLADPTLAVPDWMRAAAEAEGFRSVVAAPLRSGGEVLGALVLRDVAGRAFTEGEQQLLSAFAAQAALALRNAESHAAALARVRELDTLVQVGRTLMGTLDYHAVVRTILDAACRLVPDSVAMVWDIQPGEAELRPVDTAGLRAPAAAQQIRLGRTEGLAGPAVATRAPVMSADVTVDPRFVNRAWAAAEGLVSGVAPPLVHADTLHGILAVYTRTPYVFTETELNLLTALSSEAAATMANARLFAREHAQKAEAEALLEIAHALSATLELKQLLKLIAQRTAQAVGVTRCSINLWRDGHLTPVMSQFADGHADLGLWRKFKALGSYRLEDVPGHAEAIRTKRPVLIDDVLASGLIPAHWIATFGLRAVAVIPLIRHDEVIGTLNLEQTQGPSAWRPEQVSVATLIANQAALAVDNARLYGQVQAQVRVLKGTQAQLVQAGKLAAVGQLVAGVAHEINNPLTVVVGQAELLRLTSADPGVGDRTGKILAAARRAVRIIRELQTFARPTPQEQFLVHLPRLVERVLALRGETLHVNGIAVESDLAAPAPPVRGDPAQLEQVVLNLLLNAEHAMKGSGGPPRITVRLTAEGGRVRLAMSDTGPGIPPDVLPRIFEPFFTTKSVGQGTGLGLSICHGIVQAHGGRIWAESPPGQGATVVVELPACSADGGDEPGPVRPPVDTVRRGHVLVIDDERDVAETLGAILESLGQDVTVAVGGEAGWARLRAPDALVYDLVTLDLKMPDLSGETLWQRVRTVRPALAERVIFVTGDVADPDTRRFLADTGRPVLHKPFDQAALAALLPPGPPTSAVPHQPSTS